MKTILKKCTARVLALGGLLFLSACSTVPSRYIPSTMGPVQGGEVVDDLECRIEPERETIVIGDVLLMTVVVRNNGTRSLWFPKKPDIVVMWVYPDGKRDNMVFEVPSARFFRKDQVVELKPGQQYKTQIPIKTYYFPKPGITEFQAFCNSPSNTNPEITPFWQGRVFSNSYGVQVEKRRIRS